jgi:hypothetical protein
MNFVRFERVSDLREGDVVQHADGRGYIIVHVDGHRAVAVRTVIVTNPVEWVRAVRAEEKL